MYPPAPKREIHVLDLFGRINGYVAQNDQLIERHFGHPFTPQQKIEIRRLLLEDTAHYYKIVP